MADELTPNGEGTPRASRPPVRLGHMRPRLGAAGRLGGEVAGSRSPQRVMRAATRLTATPPASPAPAAEAPPSAFSASAPPAPAAPSPAEEIPRGIADWQATWIFEGDAAKAIKMSENPGEVVGGRQRKLERSRGARIEEGPASAAPEVPPSVAVSRTPSTDAPQAAAPSAGSDRSTLPPVPGASLSAGGAEPAPRRSRVARAKAGSARSAPAGAGAPEPPVPAPAPEPRVARRPRPAGEPGAPVKLALRRKAAEPPPAPSVRPRMQPAIRSRPVAAPAPEPMQIVIPEEKGLFRRVIDTLTGRGDASEDDTSPAAWSDPASAAVARTPEPGTTIGVPTPPPPPAPQGSGPRSVPPSPSASGQPGGAL